MLKIKDNVDLKILEKYGFNTTASSKVGTYDWHDNFVDDNFGYIIGSGIEIYDRDDLECTRRKYLKITVNTYDGEPNLDTLYDLIQDGLVEKVGENND